MPTSSTSVVARFGLAAPVLSLLMLITSAVAAVAALAWPELIHGPAVMIGSMRGTALVMLVLAIPILVLGMATARTGSVPAAVAWLAGLVFVTYQAWMFLFAVPFNGLFLVYVAMLAFGFWGVVVLLARLEPERLVGPAGRRLPVRLLAGWIAACCIAFYGLWLKNVGPALFDSESPAFLAGTGMVTATNYVLDMAFFLPFGLISAVALWRRTAWGVIVGGAMLVVLVLESISIGVDQWLGSAADPGSSVASAALTPMFLGLAAIGAVMVAVWYRGTTAAPHEKVSPTAAHSIRA